VIFLLFDESYFFEFGKKTIHVAYTELLNRYWDVEGFFDMSCGFGFASDLRWMEIHFWKPKPTREAFHIPIFVQQFCICNMNRLLPKCKKITKTKQFLFLKIYNTSFKSFKSMTVVNFSSQLHIDCK
jgi:hypothetical protein